MLTEKSWRGEAILRLVLSLLICVFAGSVLAVGVQQAGTPILARLLVFALVGLSVLSLGASLVLLRRVWETRDPLWPMTAMLACFSLGWILGALASRMTGAPRASISQMILSALSLQGAFLVLLIPFLREHNVTLTDAFGLKHRWVLAVGLGVLVGCIFLPIGWILQGLSAELMSRLHLAPQQQQVVQTLETDHAGAARAVFAVISIVLVPPAEESFFRGILYPWIKRAGYPQLALWGTSLAFAATHLNLMSFLPLTLFAVALAVLYEVTGNLLAPVTAHAAFNAANMVKLYVLDRALS